MGETVSFPTKGGTASGYLATPDKAPRPGVLVVQEWWGLDSGIKEMTDRLAASGFVALAPDLYRGALAGHDEIDKAEALMRQLPPDRAADDMSGAIDFLAGHPRVAHDRLGVVGFCMGGLLSFLIAAKRPDKIKALAPFYGYPSGPQEPDWSPLVARVRGHMAEREHYFPPEGARALEAKLRKMGKDVVLQVHPGSGHAFMAPHNALGTFDQALADRIWPKLISFLEETLALGR